MTVLTVADAARLIAAGELSPVELTRAALERIEQEEPTLHAFARVEPEHALAQARAAEAELAAGRSRGPLHGIPVGVKDVFDTAGVETAAGSRTRSGRVPEHDAAAVAALRSAGAVVVGKTVTTELAVGIVDAPTRNPWDRERLPGGSSAGSAAAVAAGECLLALGSDTGGSVRIPATLCGVTGLRPTFGRISRHGMEPASWSLDQPGPIARTALDVAHALTVLAGRDPRDPATLAGAVPDFAAQIDAGIDGATLGVATNLLPRVDAGVQAAVDVALSVLEGLGARLVEVELPLLELVLPTYLPLAFAELAALHRDGLRERPDDYGEGVRLPIEAGQLVRVADHLDAQRARGVIAHAWRELYERHGLDAIVAPGLPVPAPPAATAAHRWPDGDEQDIAALAATATVPSSLTGLPTLALPCGFAAGLPAGLQLIGRPLDEPLLLRAGHAYQCVTDWTTRETERS